MEIQGVTGSYKELQEVTGGYRGLQEVAGGNNNNNNNLTFILRKNTCEYDQMRIPRGYRRVTRGYTGIKGAKGGYEGL